MHGKLVRKMPEKVDKDKTSQWLSESDLKTGTEALLCAGCYVLHRNRLPVQTI